MTSRKAAFAGLKTNQSSFDVFFPIVEYFHPNGYNNANPASVNYEPLSTVIGFENDGFYMNFKRNNIGEYDGPRYVFYFIWRFTVSGVETTTENH